MNVRFRFPVTCDALKPSKQWKCPMGLGERQSVHRSPEKKLKNSQVDIKNRSLPKELRLPQFEVNSPYASF